MADPHEIDMVYREYFNYWDNHPQDEDKIECFVDGTKATPNAFKLNTFREEGFMATANGNYNFLNLLACLYAANMGRFFYFYRGK